MGINSIHSAPEDFIWAKNTTNGTEFRCQVKTKDLKNYRVVSQMDVRTVKFVLVIHGYCDINTGDFIKLPLHDRVLKVQGVLTPTFDESLARKRNDYSNFKSETEVALS